MRKFFAWLWVAALVVVSFGPAAHAAGPTVLKPYIVLILDTSGSMRDATGSGPPTCADANGNLLPDNKLNHARCAINNIVNTYGDIVFAFARFREDTTTRTGDGGAQACGTNSSSPTGCHLSQDACNTNSDRFQMLTALDDLHCSTTVTKQCLVSTDCPGGESCVSSSNPSNAGKTATWSDFTCNTCNQPVPEGHCSNNAAVLCDQNATCGAGNTCIFDNPETWNAVGATPIDGSLAGASCYWQGLNLKSGHCSNSASSCEANSQCGAGTCIFDESCTSSGGVSVWPSNVAGFSPIVNDPTDTKFIPPVGMQTCNPSPSCFQTVIAASPNGASESGNVGTFTTVTPHGLSVGDSVKILGVGVGGYNGTFTVTSVAPTSFTVTLPGPANSLAASGGGTEILASLTNCCQTQCRPYITIMLTDGDETCGGFAGHCSNAISTGCNVDSDCGTGTCSFTAGRCSTTTTQSCYINGECPQGETCNSVASIEAIAARALHTVVTDGSPSIAKQYRIRTIPIGFGVPVGYAPIENLALAGGGAQIPGFNGGNAGYYAADEAGLELAISQIIESSVRGELCNGIDDDCDGAIDEDFIPPLGNACDNGLKGVCKGTGNYICSTDGTGVVCNITSPGGTPQTSCPPGKVCNSDGTEVCGDGLDNNCNGLVDEGCNTGCTPPGTAELCNSKDDDCNGLIDNGIPSKVCGVFPGAACSPNTACCGVQQCEGPCVNQPDTCVGTDAYGACSTNYVPIAEICNNIDDDCDGIVDEDLTRTCSSISGGNPGDPTHYHCAGTKTTCTGPTDNSCPGGAGACVPPIPQNICHPGTQQCTSGSFGACTGEVVPGTEICDGLDNDCDNIIDEDTGGGACNATCGVGTIICAGGPVDPGTCCQPGSCAVGQHQCGTLYCSAVSVTVDATCDGQDDDCDGKVDEDWACGDFHCASNNALCTGTADTSCPGGAGQCVATPAQVCDCTASGLCNGQNKCVTGTIMCQGTPIDPSSCCDCGGNPQNGSCSGGASCSPSTCQCAYPCSGGEFPCPSGKKCDMSSGPPGFCVPDPCFGINCPTSPQGNAQSCYDNSGSGQCVDTCDPRVTTCPTGLRCYGPTGQCDPDDCTSPFPDRQCAANQNCVVDPNTGVGQCVTNPCAGVNCPDGQYCEQGSCIASCATVTCPANQRCRLGVCEPNPCGHACPFGKVCNDATGACVDDPCQFRNCPQGQWCNPNDGMCESDPCVGTMCPSDPPNQVCKGGTCYNSSDFQPDGGNEVHVTVGGGGGCNTGGGGAGLVLALGVLLLRRKRTGKGGAL